jgi:hypothetical protein
MPWLQTGIIDSYCSAVIIAQKKKRQRFPRECQDIDGRCSAVELEHAPCLGLGIPSPRVA